VLGLGLGWSTKTNDAVRDVMALALAAGWQVVAGWQQGGSRVGGGCGGWKQAGWQDGREGGGQAKVPPQCMPKIRSGQISTL
jgi:hypothetical protein